MGKKTTIYLDVDGVLNAIPPSRTLREDSGWHNWDASRINGYIITWSPDLVDALNALAARDDVEVRWLTTWRELAVEHIVPGIGLNGAEWVVVSDGEPAHGYKGFNGVFTGGWWKMDAMREDVAKGDVERVVWIDDDLPLFTTYARQVHNEAGIDENNRLYIGPHTRVGLTRDHLSAIIEFVDNN